MKLLVVYVLFVAIGEPIAYVLGRATEMFSPTSALPVFLTLFFVVFWAAWRGAVRVA